MEDTHAITEWVDGWPMNLAAAALPGSRLPVSGVCASPHCGAATRLRLNRKAACSPECLRLLLSSVVLEESKPPSEAALASDEPVRPLIGRLLVEQGSITEAQLAQALHAQRATGAGRLGSWLKQQMQLADADLTAALALQWRCSRLRVGSFAPAAMAAYLPRPLLEQHGALPLRVSALADRLCLSFEDHQSPALIRAVERMHGMEVEAGLLTAPEFWRATRELLAVRFPRVKTVDAVSPESMMAAMCQLLALPRVADAHLVAIDSCYWLRVWTIPEIDDYGSQLGMCDVICTLRAGSGFERAEFLAETDALFHAMCEVLG